ncbi:MAG: hypothetical protein KBG28_24615 [Kofleriaceae bacterium]|jgi:hypothetical protein|nr:hypothetical protein [Kofleriaceae bacterium]MBP9207174.1 hypothetical protein [Kofleriaceae bacterium]
MKKLALAVAGALLLTAAPVFACPHEGGGDTTAPKTAEKDKAKDGDKAKTKDTSKDTAKKEAPKPSEKKPS